MAVFKLAVLAEKSLHISFTALIWDMTCIHRSAPSGELELPDP